MKNVIRKRKLPLWGPKWDEDALRERRRSLTAQSFERGFRQRPFSEEDRLFSLEDIARCTRTGLSAEDVLKMPGTNFTGVDLSSTTRPGVSFFTMRIVSDAGIMRRCALDVNVGVYKGRDLIRQFSAIENKYRPQVFLVENNSLQERIIDMLSIIPETASLPIAGYYTGKQKVDPDSGLPSLSVEMQNDLWVIPWRGRGRKDNPPDGHGYHCGCGLCQWYYDEIMMYPMAETSDALMSMWFAREAYRLYGAALNDFEIWVPPSVAGTFTL